jgi:hypothetical protein
MAELTETDRQRITVAGNTNVVQPAIGGVRSGGQLKPWPPLTKYAVVLEEQPMPESLTTSCGAMSLAQQASTIAAVIESWPQPAHSVEVAPS